MTTPHQPIAAGPADGMLAQILLKQGEMGTQLAVISEKLSDLPDHEQRIRTLEAAQPADHEQRIRVLETSRAKIFGASVVLGAVAGGGASWIALAVTRR
jgi:hypothetical protein